MSMYTNLKFEMPSRLCNAKTIGDFIKRADGISPSLDFVKRRIEAIVTNDRVHILKTLAKEFGFRLIAEEAI